jgi:SAM-dependent methyltransferase
MSARQKIRVAVHIEIEWLGEDTAPAVCPNCAATVPARQYLEIDYRPPDAAHRFVLQICPLCTARFVDNTQTMDYATDELIEIGWNTYQVQLGAGVWPISAPLTRVEKPTGARMLEIGGAYGFGLDFGIRARGWNGEGFDPSPLAAFGARELGLTIHQEYFEEKDLASGPWDVVIATEVIEHIEHPPEFFALMRRALAEDGILVLTTPDAEWITPELSAGALMPLLSPGAHLVLQTQASLQAALLASGFAHVVVKRDAMSLVAYASRAPFVLNEDAAAARAMYRRYLVERAELTAPTSDLRLGFAGRGLFEAANDSDAAGAEAAWASLLPAAKQRFGLDLGNMPELPAAHEASLAELAQLMPIGLGMIFYARAMYLLGAGNSRAVALPVLRDAGAAVTALQNALARRSLTDGLSADLGRIIEGEILLCLADVGDPACVAGLVKFGDPVIGWRGFIALVNAGAMDVAQELRLAMLPEIPDDSMPDHLQRDATLSLANLALAPGRAFGIARALRLLRASADSIVLRAFTRLVNATEYATARLLLPLVEPILIKLRPPFDAAARDALFSAGILFLQTRNDWHRSVTTFARLRDALVKSTPPGTTPDTLFWPALRGELMVLHRLKRGAEVTTLLTAFIDTYPNAPDDLRSQIGSQIESRPVSAAP